MMGMGHNGNVARSVMGMGLLDVGHNVDGM